MHSILQIFRRVVDKAGYAAGSELELRIDPEWEPKPDIAASLESEDPYPTKPVDIVAEILSPEDSMPMVFQKCSHCARLGIKQIFVLDPQAKTAWEWDRQRENLERVTVFHLGNGYRIRLDTDVWPEMERRHARLKKCS